MRKRKLLAVIMSALCIAAALPAVQAFADGQKVVTLGADLTEEQKEAILRYFGVYGQNLLTLTITNQDERNHLGAYVPLEQIGSYTFSCALVNPTSSGGIQVKTANLTWVTSNMIATTLSTSGVKNCEVLAAAPFEVSGTGALTGILMAYESAVGAPLDSAKKEVATQELITTTAIADSIGQAQATDIVNESKMQVIQGHVVSENDIDVIIEDVAEEEQISLSEEDRAMLAELMQQIAEQDYQYEDMKTTLERVEENMDALLEQQPSRPADAEPEPFTETPGTEALLIDDYDFYEEEPETENWYSGVEDQTETPETLPPDSILNMTDDSALGESVLFDATDDSALPETEPEAQTDPGIDIEIFSTDTYSDPSSIQTEAPAEPAPEIGIQTEAPADPAPEIDIQTEAPAEPAPEIDIQTEAPAEQAPEVDIQTEAPAEPAPEIDIQTEAPAEPAPEIDIQTEAPAEPAPEIDIQTEAPAEQAPEVDIQTEAPAAPAPEIDVQTEAPAEPAPETDVQTEAPAEDEYGIDTMMPETGDPMFEVPEIPEMAETELETETEAAAAVIPAEEMKFSPASSDGTVLPAGVNRLTICFQRDDIVAGSGSITLISAYDSSVIETVSAADTSKVTLEPLDGEELQELGWERGSRAVILLSSPLAQNASCYVNLSEGAFVSADGTAYSAAVEDEYTWTVQTSEYGFCMETSGLTAGNTVSGQIMMDGTAATLACIEGADPAMISVDSGEFTASGSFSATLNAPGKTGFTVCFYDGEMNLLYSIDYTLEIQ